MAQATPKTEAAPKPEAARKTRLPGKAPAALASDRQVYLGPGLPGLAHGSVFRGGLPAPVAALVAARPGLKECFRPLAGLPAAKLELADADSRLSRAYREAARPGATEGGERA